MKLSFKKQGYQGTMEYVYHGDFLYGATYKEQGSKKWSSVVNENPKYDAFSTQEKARQSIHEEHELLHKQAEAIGYTITREEAMLMMRDERSYQQLTLGNLIDLLSPFVDHANVKLVEFSDGTHPKHLNSYRGYYEDLAIGYFEYGYVLVNDFYKELKNTVGNYKEGYKGGDFQMSEDTPIWKANYGFPGGAITGVTIRGSDNVFTLIVG